MGQSQYLWIDYQIRTKDFRFKTDKEYVSNEGGLMRDLIDYLVKQGFTEEEANTIASRGVNTDLVLQEIKENPYKWISFLQQK